MVCRLHKSLYGLKQAPRAWYERLYNYLMKIGFEMIDDKKKSMHKDKERKKYFFIWIFVDHIISGDQDSLCKNFANQVKLEFEISMFGEINFFVGLQVYQIKYGIYITQPKNIKEILKTFGLEDSKSVITPMVIGHKLSKNDDSTKVNQTLYRSMIDKLQYMVIVETTLH